MTHEEELNDLKSSILNSGLKNYLSSDPNISFKNKVLLAIDSMNLKITNSTLLPGQFICNDCGDIGDKSSGGSNVLMLCTWCKEDYY